MRILPLPPALLATVFAFTTPALAQLAPGELPRTHTSTSAIDSDIHAAVDALIAGDDARARAILETVAARAPMGPSAALARDLLGFVEKRIARRAIEQRVPVAGGTRAVSADTPAAAPAGVSPVIRVERTLGEVLRDEARTGLARAELVTGQTLHGLVLGVELCALAECEDVRAFAATILLGAGGGLGLSLALTGDGVTSGQAAITNAGAQWGAWNALALNLSLGDDPEPQAIFGTMILAQLAGVGASQLLYHQWRPSSGDVSLTNSVGLWSGALTSMLLLASEDVESETIIGVSLLASDIGLLAGMYLASRYPMSRGRALLIDLGGGVGTLVGVGLDLIANGEDAETTDLLLMGASGAVAGLALSTYLTRHWDLEEAPVPSLAVMPTEGGARVLIGGTW